MERRVLMAYLQGCEKAGQARHPEFGSSEARHIVSKLAAIGADTAQAEAVLEAFQQMQNARLLSLQQILNALDECCATRSRVVARATMDDGWNAADCSDQRVV
jgi:hypothetical protein